MALFSRIVVGVACFYTLIGSASEKTLSALKPGAVIRTTQNVDVEIPSILKQILDSDLPLVITGGRAIPLFMAHNSPGPACLVVSRKLDFKDPARFKLPQGAEFVIKSVTLEKSPNPLFAGAGTLLEVATPDGGLKGTFNCFPGKAGRTPISLEAFEEAFGRKIRVELEGRPKS